MFHSRLFVLGEMFAFLKPFRGTHVGKGAGSARPEGGGICGLGVSLVEGGGFMRIEIFLFFHIAIIFGCSFVSSTLQ